MTETAALALAAAGDIASAAKLADELEQKYPLDSRVQNYIVSTVRAQNLLHQGRAAEAEQTLQKASATELSTEMEAT